MNFLAISLIFALLIPVCWRYLNRQRGIGNENRDGWLQAIGGKTAAICLMGALTGLHSAAVLWLGGAHPLWVLVTVPLLEIVLINALFRPSWGEIFPDVNDTWHEDFAPGIVTITNWLAGYKYNADTAANSDKEVFWKVTAWAARFGIYGTPLVLVKCYVAASLLPLFIWWLAALWVGVLYRRNRIAFEIHNHGERWLAEAEKDVGFFLGVVIVGVLL